MLYLVPLQSKYNEKYKSKGKYTTTKRLFSFALGHHHPSNRTIFIGQFLFLQCGMLVLVNLNL